MPITDLEQLQELLCYAEQLMFDIARLMLRTSDCDDVTVKMTITQN